MIELRRSDAAETEDLRRRVLRPGSTGPLPGDGEPAGMVLLAEHCRAAGGTLLWANARLPALEFYRRAGFVTSGEPWTDPEIGPHVVITLTL